MITQIIIDQVLQTLNWGFAGAVSVLLFVFVLVTFLIFDRVVGIATLTGSASGSGAAGARRSNGRSRRCGTAILVLAGAIHDRILSLWPARRADVGAPPPMLRLFVWSLLLVISLPALLMIPLSFSGTGLNWPPQSFTWQWYREVLTSPLWTQAAIRSLVIALGTGLLSTLIGMPAAFLLARSRMRGKGIFLAFVLSPIIVPRIIIAVGMFYVFARIGLVGNMFGLMLAHTVVAVPYVVLTMTAVLRNYDVNLDLAAQSLGAGPFATLCHVTLPILGAGMLSSFLFAFATSFDDLTIALFASGGLSATLPKQFWDEVTLQVSPVIASVSSCLFVFIAVLIFAAEYFRRRSTP